MLRGLVSRQATGETTQTRQYTGRAALEANALGQYTSQLKSSIGVGVTDKKVVVRRLPYNTLGMSIPKANSTIPIQATPCARRKLPLPGLPIQSTNTKHKTPMQLSYYRSGTIPKRGGPRTHPVNPLQKAL
ncbi:MAG: hypothetical protein D6694_13890 [Gammaproteobacteria bacterium]|nr:MAG: hypothetical protein D6694_13890 [Gammaproteobacteria bacterium]